MDLFAEGEAIAAAGRSEIDQQHSAEGFGLRSLESYLSLTLDPRAEVAPEEAYRHLLTWKGSHLARQRQVRRWRCPSGCCGTPLTAPCRRR